MARPKGIGVFLGFDWHSHVTDGAENDIKAIRISSDLAAVIVGPPVLAAKDLITILALERNVILLAAGSH